MATREGREKLPLLHKYVLQPEDDLKLVLAKLNYRLCVRDVSKVLFRRSQGDTISEAVEHCENLPENFLTQSASCTMTQNNNTTQMEPLVFEQPQFMSSPKTLNCSPSGESYTGTMKSDDSGIGMDDSHLNISTDNSDMSLSLNASSPASECDDYSFYNIPEVSRSPPVTILEDIIEAKEHDHVHSNTDIDEFFNRENGQVTNHIDDHQENTSDQDQDFRTPDETVVEEPETVEENIRAAGDRGLETGAEGHVTDEDNVTTEDHVTAVDDDDDDEKRDEEVDPEENQIFQEEEQQDEGLPEEEPEDEGTEYIKEDEIVAFFESGLRCDDVQNALVILKTKYKLNSPSVRKFVITFSAWDLRQIMYGPEKSTKYWDENYNLPEENEELEEVVDKIYNRHGEISDLVDRIMEEEALKKKLEAALAKQPPPMITDEPIEEPVIEEVADEPTKEENAPPEKEKDPKKRQRNVFQRLMHAIRKRVRRNRGEQSSRKAA